MEFVGRRFNFDQEELKDKGSTLLASIIGVGVPIGITFLVVQVTELVKSNDTSFRQESVDGNRVTYDQSGSRYRRNDMVIGSVRNPLTDSFIDKYKITEVAPNRLLIEALDNEDFATALTLIRGKCGETRVTDLVNEPTVKLATVTQEGCLFRK